MKIAEIIDHLEKIAPPAYQESYDNAGLITGNKQWETEAALFCLDATEDVIEEALQKGCNLIVAHHPIVFKGLKSITGKNYIERVLIKAIKNDIAIYAIHTNLDNVAHGVNQMIASKLGLSETRILAPMPAPLRKLITFCPISDADRVRTALSEAGAGNIGNYTECSYNVSGYGTFKGNEEANPSIGEKEKLEKVEEIKIEMVFPFALQVNILKALQKTHPYEEVAYDIVALENQEKTLGAGMIGRLPEPMKIEAFWSLLKDQMKVQVIRHTNIIKEKVEHIALCGGSGSFLLPHAIRQKADIFITGDFKYHEFFDADKKIVIADIGHYESEQFTPHLLVEILREKFDGKILKVSECNTNPVNYFF